MRNSNRAIYLQSVTVQILLSAVFFLMPQLTLKAQTYPPPVAARSAYVLGADIPFVARADFPSAGFSTPQEACRHADALFVAGGGPGFLPKGYTFTQSTATQIGSIGDTPVYGCQIEHEWVLRGVNLYSVEGNNYSITGVILAWQCPAGYTLNVAPNNPIILGGIYPHKGMPYNETTNKSYDLVVGGKRICYPQSQVSQGKNTGARCDSTPFPIAIPTKNKHLHENDYQVQTNLRHSRHYNSLTGMVGKPYYGSHWQANYLQHLIVSETTDLASVIASRPDSRNTYFNKSTGQTIYAGESDVADRLIELLDNAGQRTGWLYHEATNDQIETYDPNGKLLSIQNREGAKQTLAYTDGTNGAISGRGGYVRDSQGLPTTTVLPAGLLLYITDQYGRRLTFGYDNSSRINTVIDPAGMMIRYSYTGSNLTSVIYQDGKSRIYHYEDSNNYLLTGVTDENANRYVTYEYQGGLMAIREVFPGVPGNVNQYQLSGGSVTDPLGTTRTYTFTYINGVQKITGQSQPGGAGCGAAAASLQYDANGNVIARGDFNPVGYGDSGIVYGYDLTRNLETTRVEGVYLASGSVLLANGVNLPVDSRKISTQWHPHWRLVTRVAEPLKMTTYVYNGQPDPTAGNITTNCAPANATVTALLGNSLATVPIAVLCKKVEQATTDANGSQAFVAVATGAPRVWTYTYNNTGQLLTSNGPRTDNPGGKDDLTTYTYYATATATANQGDLATITNALGHTTTFNEYNKHGQVLRKTDPNGVVTTNTYDLRQRLVQQQIGAEITRYDYDGMGQLIKETRPDNSYTQYTYDNAHRLIQVQDNLGNKTVYTLDAIGNRIQEDIYDAAGLKVSWLKRQYDALNRLQSETRPQQ